MDTSLRNTTTSVVPGLASIAPANGKTEPQGGKALPLAEPVTSGKSAAATLRSQHSENVGDKKPVDVDQTREAVRQINDALREKHRELEFSVDEGSGRTIVKVIHSESGEVIRQLPPEVVLKFASAFTEGSASLLEDFA